MDTHESEVVVAVFASRDSVRTVLNTIKALPAACAQVRARVEIIVNGNPSLARALSAALSETPSTHQSFGALRVWSIAVADKANAWNQCLDKLVPPQFSGVLVCVDGYAMPTPGAIAELADYLRRPNAALAACGTAQNGPSVAFDYRGGKLDFGLRGGLFALSGACLREFRRVGFSLPIGIYRNDGLIGAVLAFGLDTSPRVWNESRLKIFAKIGWETEPVPIRVLTDFRGYVFRAVRQAQGRFENAAIHDTLNVRAAPIHKVSVPIADLVAQWMRAHPVAALKLLVSHPFALFGIGRMFARQRRWATHANLEQFVPHMIWGNKFGYGRRTTDLTEATARRSDAAASQMNMSSLLTHHAPDPWR